MKKTSLVMAVVLISGLFLSTQARYDPETMSKTTKKDMKTGESILIENADRCLAIMEQAAQKMSVKGVALVAFIPGDIAESWTSKMIVIGALSNESANYLAIAYSKAAEMADTYKISGSSDRDPLHGEFGYQGGIIKKVDSGYILTVFSGATGEQDAEIARKGLDCLYKFY